MFLFKYVQMCYDQILVKFLYDRSKSSKVLKFDSPAPTRKRAHASPRTSGDESCGSSSKKVRINGSSGNRRKVARKVPFDEDKTSPVSGTLIRELADGEEIPAIHKGQKDFFISFFLSYYYLYL